MNYTNWMHTYRLWAASKAHVEGIGKTLAKGVHSEPDALRICYDILSSETWPLMNIVAADMIEAHAMQWDPLLERVADKMFDRVVKCRPFKHYLIERLNEHGLPRTRRMYAKREGGFASSASAAGKWDLTENAEVMRAMGKLYAESKQDEYFRYVEVYA